MKYELNTGWKCIRASLIYKQGEEISQPSFPLKGWMPAVVPGTVLTTLLNNKLIPDPFYGMNNKLIPDIYDVGKDYYSYWFEKDFEEKPGNEAVFLQFRGINYIAEVFLNGKKINPFRVQGMYLRHEFDITPYLSKTGHNRLLVYVSPPDPVGNPNGGQGGDGIIAHCVTNQFTAGWDWIQPVHDRNTGIWDKVFIKKVKKVKSDNPGDKPYSIIINPHVVTLVPGIRKTTGFQNPATVKVSLLAGCMGSGTDATANKNVYTIECELDGRTVSSEPLKIENGTENYVELPDIKVENPRLWWPNGYGPQNLYTLKIKALVNNTISDEEEITIGIRQLDAVWNAQTQSRELHVNGQKIFIKGGNRILSDEMLRFTKERYDAEVRFHKDMNLNLIRVWGGGITERPEFYDACDKYGIMVMQDFWVSGDCNGRWYDPTKKEDTIARRKYPDDKKLLLESMEDQIMMLRNHPSLTYWCGGNEIRPPASVLHKLQSAVHNHDGTRFLFDYSNDDSMSYQAHDGPYTIQPDTFFWSHRSWGFNSEVGSIGIGELESLQKFLPEKNQVIPLYDTLTHAWKIDSLWKYHKYCSYDSAIEVYGHPTNLEDFAKKAQLVNYNQYRALIEGATAHMWDWYTGTIIWKTQNPWTAMLGQMYDVYLDPNACLFGTSEGSQPVHIMYDPMERTVKIANNRFDTLKKLRMVVKAYKMNGEEVPFASEFIDAPSFSCEGYYTFKKAFKVFSMDEGVFLYLGLTDSLENQVDENLYWLPDENGAYSGLMNMAKAPVTITTQLINKGKVAVSINNKYGNPVAFFNRISLIDPVSKKRILPVFYSNNYISVLPGLQETVVIEFTPQAGIMPLVCVEGWNVEKQYVEVKR